jgi:hypothetical protein
MAGILILLATFAGALTLSTQFSLDCPCSRFKALLSLGSQTFLAAPLVLLSEYLLLYRGDDRDSLKTWEHTMIVTQFIVAGLLICSGFVLLGAAIYTAQPGSERWQWNGIWGLTLLCWVSLLAIISGVLYCTGVGKVRTAFSRAHSCTFPGIWPTVFCAILLVTELSVLGLLLGMGGWVAASAPIQHGCNVEVGSGASESRSIALSSCLKTYTGDESMTVLPSATTGPMINR